MSHVLRTGQADQIAYFRAFNTDGSALTTLTAATDGLSLSVFRVGGSSVSIASLSNKAADNTAHADGAIGNVGGNLYTIDLPDAACATQVPSIGVRGTFTGGVVEPVIHPLVGYDPTASAVGANTVTPPTLAQIEASTVIAKEATVAARATQASVDTKPTLAQIEASSVIAKEATVNLVGLAVVDRPTLAAIEGSTILAKEATVSARASQASVDTKPTLAQIEASTVIATKADVEDAALL
jgi:hypothetical protein